MSIISQNKKFILTTLVLMYTCCFAPNCYGANNPKIIVKRGSDLFFENTIYAYKKSLEMGADGVEVDLQLTKDNVIVAYRHKDLSKL